MPASGHYKQSYCDRFHVNRLNALTNALISILSSYRYCFYSVPFFSPVECNCIGRHYHKRDIAKCQPNKIHTAFTLLVNRILPDGPNAFFCHYRRVSINFFLSFYFITTTWFVFPTSQTTKGRNKSRNSSTNCFFHF